jgi:hypothetical protein
MGLGVGLTIFFIFKIPFFVLPADIINRSFFISYKSYWLLEPIRNIGFQPIPQIPFVVVTARWLSVNNVCVGVRVPGLSLWVMMFRTKR